MNLLVINKTLLFFWHYRLPISIAPFSILFVTIRLPFWADVNVFFLFDDASSYARIAQDIVSGNVPLFNVRTPGYPLYLAFFLKAFGNNLGVVFAANALITLLVSLAFIYVFYRIYPSYTYASAITVGLFTSSISFLNRETAYLTEHLYMTMLLGFVAWLILAVKRTSALYLIALSLWFSLVVYVRPSGLFLLPLLAVLSLWIRYRKYPAKFQLALWLPLVLAYLLLSSYNKATLNMFTLTPFGEINLAYATTTFAQPDPELPDYVNRAILVSTRQITEADRRYLIDGKDVQRLTAIYLKYYNNHALLSNLQKYGNYRAPDDYTNLHADVKRVAYSAIKQNKRAYAKFVYTNFVHYFRNFSPENRVSYPYLNKDFKYWEQNRLVGFFTANQIGKAVLMVIA